ncbi:MAG: 2'-5' RNA ligase family protein [Planctomycetota bacterium]
MSRPRNHPQVYVGVTIPTDRARAWIEQLQASGCPAGVWTEPSCAVLTVLYLAGVPQRELDRVEESVDRAAAGVTAFTLTAQRLASLPDEGPARQIALITDAPAPILDLRHRLVTRLSHSARGKPDAFVPRVPLLRFATPQLDYRFARPVADSPLPVDRVLILETHLGGDGRFVRVLHEAPLATPRV